MINFRWNKIQLNSESASEQLRCARQAKKIKLEDAAKKLNIHYKYLQALENGNYKELPSGVYGKNFLREYASYLDLDIDEILKMFAAETDSDAASGRRELFSKQVVKSRHFIAAPKIIKNAIIILIALICFSYLGYRLGKVITPPVLSVYSPAENIITEKHNLQIAGSSENEASIIINGELVLSDKDGQFNKTINLKNGINTITITASKKYGRDNTIVRQVLVKNIN